MTDSTRRILRGLSLAGFFLVGWSAIQVIHLSEMNVWAGSLPSIQEHDRRQAMPSVAEHVFNGKGVCYYCHGIDGNMDQRPQLAADTAALIDQLNPPPADLRNPKALSI